MTNVEKVPRQGWRDRCDITPRSARAAKRAWERCCWRALRSSVCLGFARVCGAHEPREALAKTRASLGYIPEALQASILPC